MIRVRESGDDWSLLTDEVRRDTEARALVVVDRASIALHKDIVARLSRSGGGRPAPEGNAPALQTGELSRAFAPMPAKLKYPGGKAGGMRRPGRATGGVHTPSRTRRDGQEWWPIIGALEYGSVRMATGTAGTNYSKRKAKLGMKSLGAYHMRPRPFIRPAEEAIQPVLDRLMVEAFA
jgi:hypothetical protein